MKVSAIIPTYNRRHTVARAIDSVLQQSSPVDEIIVIDDGSSDGTAEFIELNYPSVTLLRQANQGVSAARNAGIKQAKNEWVALLDSDDGWLPDKMAAIREAHAQQPEILLYHSDEIWIRNGVRVNAMHKHRKSGGWIFPNCLPLCVISPSAAVINRQLLLDKGMFNESLPACEDYDLWLKICHQHPVGFVERPLINKYGGHNDQLSRAFVAMDRFRILAIDDLLNREPLIPDYEALSIQTLNSKLEILLVGAHKHGNQALIDSFTPLQQKWAGTMVC